MGDDKWVDMEGVGGRAGAEPIPKSRMALLTAVMATSVQAFVRWFAGAEGRPARGHSPPYCTCSQIYIRNGPHQ